MKKFVIGVLTIALAALTLFTMTACDKIVKLEITLSLYDAEDEAMEEKTITFDMYENLAESAVNAVRDAVNGGAYDDCVFYVQSVDRGTSVSSQLMFGGLKKSGKSYVKVEQAAVPTAEFEKNGVMGSNLKNLKGYLGLWRSWDSWKSYSTSGFDRSSAVIYMPTTDSISAYDGNFCVFAKYSAEDDLDVIESLIALLEDEDNYTEYTCYYTADADGTLARDAEGKPVWNIVATENFDDVDNVYDSADDKTEESSKDTQYDSYTVQIPDENKIKIESIRIA